MGSNPDPTGTLQRYPQSRPLYFELDRGRSAYAIENLPDDAEKSGILYKSNILSFVNDY